MPGPDPDAHIVRVRVTGADPEVLRAFIAQSGAEAPCRPVAVRTERGLQTQLLLSRAQLNAARSSRAAADVELVVEEDVSAAQEAARSAVGTGDRFAGRAAAPRGLGRKE